MTWTWDNGSQTFDQTCWKFDGSTTCKRLDGGGYLGLGDYPTVKRILEEKIEQPDPAIAARKSVAQAIDATLFPPDSKVIVLKPAKAVVEKVVTDDEDEEEAIAMLLMMMAA